MLTVFQYRGKSSIEETMDFFFSPASYLFGGKKIDVIQTCSKNGNELKQNNVWREYPIQYERNFLRTVFSIAFLLVPFTIIGGAFYLARAVFGNHHAMQADYRLAVENKTVISKPLEQKHVVIIKDNRYCDERLLILFKHRYSNDTKFSFIDGSQYTNASKSDLEKSLPKTHNYDLILVASTCFRYFFDVEGCMSAAALDLYRSRNQKTLVRIIEDSNPLSPEFYLAANAGKFEYKDQSFELEQIPESYLKA